MTQSESPFLLVQSSSTEITKTSLSALIQHKQQVSKTYPALVNDIVNGVAFVEVPLPLVRQMQEDHPALTAASTMRIHADVRVGDAVLIQNSNGEWTVNTTLTEPVYNERVKKDLTERLLLESRATATPHVKRASKRMLESWLGLSTSESTPWGVPGRLNQSQKLISKKILQWCINKMGTQFQQRLQEGFPNSKEWGELDLYFALFVNAEQRFVAVSIQPDEHKALVELWADILRNRHSNNTAKNRPIAPVSTTTQPPVVAHTARPANPIALPQTHLPASICSLAESFHLPVPKGPVSPTLSTLGAWSQSDHLLLKERCTDMFLMMLSGGERVRQNTDASEYWKAWNQQADPIDQLCSVVASGEELAAVRSLAGQAFLDTQTASSVCDQLLLRWRRQLIQQHGLAETALGHSLKPTATHKEYRRAMRLHGIQCPDTWLDSLLLATQVAPKMGMMIILVGDGQRAKTLTKLLTTIFEGATHSCLRLPRNRAQLFGKPSSTNDIYLHSDLGLAIRQGSHRKRYGPIGLWNPHFVCMENIYPHARRKGLSLLVQEMYFGDGIALYEDEDNLRYIEEYQRLQNADTLSASEQTRRDDLEHFFDAETLGGLPMQEAWKLRASENTILFGHIEPAQIDTTPLDLVQRALVLEIPEFSVERIEYRLNAVEDWTPLREGIRHLAPKDTWQKFGTVREQTFELLDAVHNRGIKVSDLLAKQISFLLAGAEAWELPDDALLSAQVCQLLLLPRLNGDAEMLLQGLEALEQCDFIPPQLQLQLGNLKRLCVRNRGRSIHGLMRINT